MHIATACQFDNQVGTVTATEQPGIQRIQDYREFFPREHARKIEEAVKAKALCSTAAFKSEVLRNM
jgi:hypothetical protein